MPCAGEEEGVAQSVDENHSQTPSRSTWFHRQEWQQRNGCTCYTSQIEWLKHVGNTEYITDSDTGIFVSKYFEQPFTA